MMLIIILSWVCEDNPIKNIIIVIQYNIIQYNIMLLSLMVLQTLEQSHWSLIYFSASVQMFSSFVLFKKILVCIRFS